MELISSNIETCLQLSQVLIIPKLDLRWKDYELNHGEALGYVEEAFLVVRYLSDSP